MIKHIAIDRNYSLTEREALFNTPFFSDEKAVFIKTCNRLELFYGEGEVSENIARHLFRVVSGLESCLLGEVAIQGQIKAAYLDAASKHNLSKSMHILFQTALYVGKRVRNESALSKGAMSYSNATVEIINKSGINLKHAMITIIGAHKLNEDIIRFLKEKDAETFFLGNKSYDKALQLAKKYNGQAFRLDELEKILKFTDILISATSAPHFIIRNEGFPEEKEMLIIDLAFPRDVDPLIKQRPGIILYNLEDIENRVSQNIKNRRKEIELAKTIIDEEVEIFLEKQKKNATITIHKSY